MASKAVVAQPPSTLTVYTSQNGLTQNSILSLTMDAEGFLLIGTYVGLTRFSGTAFDKIFFDSSYRYYGAANHVASLSNYKETNQTLIKTQNDSVYILKNAQPVLYQRLNLSQKDDRRKFSTQRLFDEYNFTEAELEKKYNWPVKQRQIVSVNATDFIVTGNTSKSLLYYKNGVEVTEIKLKYPVTRFLKSGTAIFLIDSNHNLLFFDTASKLFKEIACYKGKEKLLRLNNVHFLSDSYNNEFYCFLGNTFYLIELNADQNRVDFIPQFTTEKTNFTWSCILHNKTLGIYFIGTMNDGLCVFKKQWIQMHKISNKAEDKYDVNLSKQMTVLNLNKDTVIFPSGILAYNRGDNVVEERTGNVFSWERSIANYRGNAGVLCCNLSGGVDYYLKADGYKKRHAFNEEFNRINKEKAELVYPEGDSVWVATLTSIYCLTSKKITTVYKSELNGVNAPFDYPSGIYRYSDTELWLSSTKGTYRVSTHPPYTIEKIPELNGRMVYGITKYKNYLIVSVFNYGLYVYDGKLFKKIRIAENTVELPDCHVNYLNTETGDLWVVTSYGLHKTKIKSLFLNDSINPNPFFYHYGASDGIQNTVFEGGGIPAIAALNNTQLFIPALNGYFVVYSDKLLEDITPTYLHIKSILSNGQIINALSNDTISLNATDNIVTINLNIPYFGEIKNLLVEYKIDNNNWEEILIGTTQTFMLTNLSSGTHSLKLRQRIGFNNDDYVYRSLTIIKKPAYYQTFWFWAAVFIGLILLFIVSLKLYSRNINKKREELQRLVDKQTEELLQSVEVKELLINIISHDMITPLKYISLIGRVLEKELETDPKKSKQALADIKNTAENLLLSSTSILNWMKYNSGKIKASKINTNLFKILNDVCVYFEPVAKEKGITIVNAIPSSVYIALDSNIFNIILNNLISNAIKYSGSDELKITMEDIAGSKRIRMIVSDRGIGMKNDLVDLINETLSGNAKPLSTNSTGLGFLLIGELAKAHNMNITVNSMLDKGTNVVIDM